MKREESSLQIVRIFFLCERPGPTRPETFFVACISATMHTVEKRFSLLVFGDPTPSTEYFDHILRKFRKFRLSFSFPQAHRDTLYHPSDTLYNEITLLLLSMLPTRPPTV